MPTANAAIPQYLGTLHSISRKVARLPKFLQTGGRGLKEALQVFGSTAAILIGVMLLYANVVEGNFIEIGYLVGDGFGILILAAGLTGLWAVRRFRKS